MGESTSIRNSLLRDLVIVILLLGGGIFAATFIGAASAVRTLSRGVIDQAFRETALELRGFFNPVSRGLHLAREWGVSGLLDVSRPKEMNQLFRPILEEFPQIASILVADATGAQYQILRGDEGFRNRQFHPDWGEREQWLEWKAGEEEPLVEWRDKIASYLAS